MAKPKPPKDNRGLMSREDSTPHLFASIQSGNFDGVQAALDQTTEHINSSSYGGLTPLHAACHMQQLDILKLLVEKGAKMSSLDSLGNTVLHAAVREKWHVGIQELLEQGASPNVLSQPPSTVTGMVKETPLHVAVRISDEKSTSLLLQYQADFSIKDDNNNTVFHLAASKGNLVLLKVLLSEKDSNKYLGEKGNEGCSIFHAAFSGDGGVRHESQVLRVIQYLYKFHEHLNQANMYGETPLFLACRDGLPNVVKYLLNNGADPTQITREAQSVLHAACMAGCSESLRSLIGTSRVKHLVIQEDNSGLHPFHCAIQSSSIDCCKILLDNGTHLGHTDSKGVSNCKLVLDKLPSAMQLFRDILDSGVKLSKKPQHDPAFSITFDYSVLMLSEKDKMQCSIVSELAGTPLESLIKHPLIESFLYMKWYRIRSVFYTNVIQFFTFLLLHTVFIMMTFGPSQHNWSKHRESLTAFKLFHVAFLGILVVPYIIVTLANFKKYIMQWETYTRLAALVSSAIAIFVISDQVKDSVTENTVVNPDLSFERLIASMSVLLGWGELMMLLGRFPTLGAYILMFTKVGKSVIKFLLSFLSLIIGFSLSFFILFQNLNIFANYKLSFVKTLMMMTGEIAYSEIIDKKGTPSGVYCLILLSLFLFMTTIILSNLLIGLAVNDIPELKRQGKIKRLVKQASYLMAYERLIAFTYKIKFFPGKLRLFLSNRLSIKSVLTVLPNKELQKSKYMQVITEANIREAITLGSCDSPEDFPTEADEGVDHQLKAFQIRYSSDRRTQRHKFKDLSEMCGDIKSQLDQVKTKMDKQLSYLSMQLQQQIQQNQNMYNHLTRNQAD